MPEKKTPEQIAEDLFKGVKGVQDRLDALEKTMAKKSDVIDEDYIRKAGDQAKDAIEALNKLESEKKFTELQEAMEASATEAKERAEKAEAEVTESKERFAALEEEVAGLKAGKDATQDDDADVEAKQAVYNYLRKGHDLDGEVLERMARRHATKTLVGANDEQIERQVKDLVAGSGPDGGYFLQSDRAAGMIQRIFETSPLRGLANVVTTTADIWEVVLDDDEGSFEWVGETDSRDDTATPQISLLKIPVHELSAQPRATQKMLDDAGFDIEAWLAGKTSRRFSRAENASFVNGNGSQRPKGFLTYSNWTSPGVYQRNAVERIAAVTATGTAAAGTFDADDLINVQNSLFEEYQANASWGMARETFTKVLQLRDANGQYIVRQEILMADFMKMIFGKPVTFLNDMPNPAANSLSIIIADWQEFYTIVDRMDIRVLRDPFTAKPYVRFYTTKRVGGAVMNYEAGKILQLDAP